MKTKIKFASQSLAAIACVLGLGGEHLNAAQDGNPIMQMGIIQRFGENPQDRLTIKATNGGKLNLSFKSGDGKRQTVIVDQVDIAIFLQNLNKPRLDEKVVLSNHRSYENAAASAFRFKAQGIETEVAQPRRWQVWAKRSVYDSSILRNLLFYSLRLKGFNLVQIDSKTLRQQPLLSWTVGSYRYNRDSIDITSDRGVIMVNQRQYAGGLRLQKNAHQTYTLVNQVPLETYLRGVVPHEIGYKAPYAAVQAQAILARTYALASRHRFAVDNYELCSTTQCQVYRGLEETSPLADKAIADTEGKVLTYKNKVVDALYSSTTGGVTASYNDLWDGKERPYLKSVVDSISNVFDSKKLDLSSDKSFKTFINQKAGFNEEGWDAFRWKSDSSLDEIKTTLLQFLRFSGDPETKFNEIKQVNITERSPSGRVLKIEVETDTKKITLEKDEIIDGFYAPSSTFFYIEPLYKEPQPRPNKRKSGMPDLKVSQKPTLKGYSFIGGGLGHGVGMSQTGSYRLGKMGWSPEQMLAFYFPGTKLQTLKPELLLTEADLAN
jgi:SpoIID/LytB domain protein